MTDPQHQADIIKLRQDYTEVLLSNLALLKEKRQYLLQIGVLQKKLKQATEQDKAKLKEDKARCEQEIKEYDGLPSLCRTA